MLWSSSCEEVNQEVLLCLQVLGGSGMEVNLGKCRYRFLA